LRSRKIRQFGPTIPPPPRSSSLGPTLLCVATLSAPGRPSPPNPTRVCVVPFSSQRFSPPATPRRPLPLLQSGPGPATVEEAKVELHYSKWANSATRSNPGADRVFVKSIRTEGPGAPPGPPMPPPSTNQLIPFNPPGQGVRGVRPPSGLHGPPSITFFPQGVAEDRRGSRAPSQNLYLIQPLAPHSANLKGMTCDPGWTDRC